MIIQLFQFFMNIIVHIFETWTYFEIGLGVNYLEFICAGIILTFVCYIIYGSIKSELQYHVYSNFLKREEKNTSNYSNRDKARRNMV